MLLIRQACPAVSTVAEPTTEFCADGIAIEIPDAGPRSTGRRGPRTGGPAGRSKRSTRLTAALDQQAADHQRPPPRSGPTRAPTPGATRMNVPVPDHQPQAGLKRVRNEAPSGAAAGKKKDVREQRSEHEEDRHVCRPWKVRERKKAHRQHRLTCPQLPSARTRRPTAHRRSASRGTSALAPNRPSCLARAPHTTPKRGAP